MSTAWVVTIQSTPRQSAYTSYLGNRGSNVQPRDGVLYLGSRTRLTDITDGSSSTILAGERPPSSDLVYGWWYAGAGQAGTGALDVVMGAREPNQARPWYAGCGPGPFHYQPGKAADLCSAFHYWSLHSGGAQFAFADGSVRLLPYSADAVLPALSTRASGEVVDIP